MTSVSPPASAGVALARAAAGPVAAAAASPWPRRFLAVPLAAKLAGANALLAMGTLLGAWLAHRAGMSGVLVLALVGVLLGVSVVTDLALGHLALRPIVELERTADRVWRGDFDARVPVSPLADRDLARVGATLNRLLDGLLADRARLRRLAAEVIRAGETERARIANELHDSTAQTLAALKMQLAVLAADGDGAPCGTRLSRVAELAAQALEEVRTLALAAHPRVLDDLGLAAALDGLARDRRTDRGPDIRVVVDPGAEDLPHDVSMLLFGVAREALGNSLRYAGARHVSLRLTAGAAGATMEVTDDGAGFDVTVAERRRGGLGLFSMRERVALADGRFEVASTPGGGTRVRATVPHAGTRT